jgi:hypothetical protein
MHTEDEKGLMSADSARSVSRAQGVDKVRALHGLWERFGERSAREELWYYGGLLELFERRRPGPLTEDLRHALAELTWLVARDPTGSPTGSVLRCRADRLG